jgi:hypothetical protein
MKEKFMLWEIILSHPCPGLGQRQIEESAASDSASLIEPLQGAGWYPIGVYAVETEVRLGTTPRRWQPNAPLAEVALVDARTPEEAIGNLRRAGLEETLADRRGHSLELSTATRFWLSPISLSPLSRQPMPLRACLLRFDLRHLHPHQTIESLKAFEERIETRYAEHLARAQWYHVGAFAVQGLPDDYFCDGVDVIRAGSREESVELDAKNDAEVPPDLQAIYDECRTFTDMSRDRIVLWMTPLTVTRWADGITLD